MSALNNAIKDQLKPEIYADLMNKFQSQFDKNSTVVPECVQKNWNITPSWVDNSMQVIPSLNMKRWHISQAKRHLTDASFKRSYPGTWAHYMQLAKWERQLASNCR